MDDRGQHLAEFRGDKQKPFHVEFGGCDLQHGHDLAGGRQGVGDEAVVGQFQHLLVPDAGQAQDLHDRPAPERPFLFPGEVQAAAGAGVLDVDASGCPAAAAQVGLAVHDEPGARGDVAAGSEPSDRVSVLPPDGGGQGGQHGQQSAGALVHVGLAAAAGLDVGGLVVTDRGRRHPRAPAGRVVCRPARDVLVEGPDGAEHDVDVDPGPCGLAASGGDDADAFLPRRRGRGVQVQ